MFKKISFLLFVLQAYSVSNAQAIRNYTLEINCKSRTYNSSQSILEFKWHYRSPNASTQYVYRKNKDRYDWGSPYRILGNRDKLRHRICIFRPSEAVDYVKTELMPDVDFTQFNRDEDEFGGTDLKWE